VFFKNQSTKYWPTHPLAPVINKFLYAKALTSK